MKSGRIYFIALNLKNLKMYVLFNIWIISEPLPLKKILNFNNKDIYKFDFKNISTQALKILIKTVKII